MTLSEKQIAYECIEKLNRLWFDGPEEDHWPEKIDSLFQVLTAVAPYRCCEHVEGLWLAYKKSKSECLWHLATYRLELFSQGLRKLQEIMKSLPETVRG